ncbi:MAG: DsbA family protein [Afipia sp.]|jgi:protein-disulfide isomerase
MAAVVAVMGGLFPIVAQAQERDVLSREMVLRDPEIPALGNPAGDITIVEWFDYQCPYCKKIAPDLARVVKEDGKIRIVHKDWPILGDASKYAARLALATRYQDKYPAAHEALISHKGRLTDSVTEEVLTKAGIDVAKAKSDLDAHGKEIDALIARNNEQAEAFGFNGTPSYIIGTFRVPGGLSIEMFKRAIADAREAAKKAKAK